jgi:O-methyltransferase
MLANSFKKIVQTNLSRFLVNKDIKSCLPIEATQDDANIISSVLNLSDSSKSLTMTSVLRLWASISSVKYIVNNNIPGSIVECGVWRGGSSIAMGLMLKHLKSDRKIYMYDTYQGMTTPSPVDKYNHGGSALPKFLKSQHTGHNSWCYASYADVLHNVQTYGLDDVCILVKGDVAETLSDYSNLPSEISLLRLDTDWYESTFLELTKLYPLLSKHGVLLIDDYGHWQGARKAVDKFFSAVSPSPLMAVTDYTGRLLVKI